jgi:hypothetical protein
MTKTNTLTSHHGESNSFPAHKMIPKKTMRFFGKWSGKAAYKRFYKRKNKMYLKNKLRKEIQNEE